MEYKILINSKGVPVLVSVPKKPSLCNDCEDKPEYALRKCLWCRTNLEKWEHEFDSALADESKYIEFQNRMQPAMAIIYPAVIGGSTLLNDFFAERIGQTFDLPEKYDIRVVEEGWQDRCRKNDCGGECGDVCAESFHKEIIKFARLVEKPESVPSCGDGWISVKDQLPKDEVRYLVAGDYNAPIGYIELAQFNEIELDGSHWISGGFAVFPTHWQPLPKAPTKH